MKPPSVSKAKLRLRGKKIFLRPPAASDYREYTGLVKMSEPVFRGLIRKIKDRKQFNEYLRRCKREDHYGFMICRNPDGAIVGSIGLFQIVRFSAQTSMVGYFVGAPHLQQGYATEALRLVLDLAFRKLKLHRVEASIQPHNAASLALVRRAGFVCEGYSRRLVKIAGKWRDHEQWAILVEDWRKPPRR